MPFKLTRTELAIVGLTLLAPCLGGSTQLWAQGVLLVLTAFLLIAAPPRRSLGLPATGIFIVLICIALSAFLPVAWFGAPPWRTSLVSDFHAVLPGTRSPQPWLSGEAFLLFLTALVWTYYLQCHTWSAEGRRDAIRLFVFGVAALAAVAAGSFFTGHTIPWWSGYQGKPGVPWQHSSFFPNRNQTADVLALSGIIAYAAALDALRRKRPALFFLLLAALGILCVELVVVYSRAGIILFFGGVAVWQMWSFYLSRSAQRAALAAAGVALVLAGFFLAGGETLERFQGKNLHALLHGDDFRVLVHHDALQMSKAEPVLGVGLGNFKALFPRSRQRSVQEDVILHPESDWLWIAVEMGWVAVALIALGIGLWLKKCLPFEPGSSRFLRSAATVCVVAFVVHGFVDVSAHRLGALWPALFLAGIATRPPASAAPGGRWVAILFRFLGLALAATGAGWLASSCGVATLPTSAEMSRLREEAASFISQRAYPEAIATSSKAIQIAPVDWTLYFQRAASESQASVSDYDARRDFATARFLEPHWDRLCLQEGELWFAAGKTGYALNAWTEALRRSLEPAPARDAKAAPRLFRQMLDLVKPDTELRSDLRVLSRKDTDCLLVFLEVANPLEFDIESMRLLQMDPGLHSLSEAQRQRFFAAWFANGDRYSLSDTLLAHPDFLKTAWRWLAVSYAGWGRYQEACETVLQDAPAPAMPVTDPSKSLADLQHDYFINSRDLQAGIALCLEQRKEGQIDAALFTLHSVQLASPPIYLSYIEGSLWAKKGDWKQAWMALGPFVSH